MPYRAYIEGSVRRDAPRSTSLRIKQQFSTRVSAPRLSSFVYAGGESVRRQRTGEDGRYAPVPLDIRSQWHHRGAYLYENVEICAADPRCTLSTASSLCISPLESPTVANVEKRCGAPGPSLRLRLRSGRQKASCVQDDREPAASMVTREELLL